MRIFSKDRDYYDSVMAYGQDETVHFRRTYHMIEKPDVKALGLPRLRVFRDEQRGVGYEFSRHATYIGFCGNLYRLIEVEHRRSGYPYQERETVRLYTLEEYLEYVEGVAAQYKKFNLDKEKKLAKIFWNDEVRAPGDFNYDLLGYVDDPMTPANLANVFLQYKTPIWVYSNGNKYYEDPNLLINPPLRLWDFYKVKDAFTAFQEIEMFLNTVLVEERPPAVTDIEDRYKISQKGFDAKLSFRKQKQV